MNVKRMLAKVGVTLCAMSLMAGCGLVIGKREQINAKWPSKPVTMIVPWGAGGDTDVYARLVAKRLTDKFGKSFVVVNTTGGSGIVGSKTAMGARPNGYTLLFGHTGSNAIQEATNTVDFSYEKDFETAGTVMQDNTYTIVVKKSDKWKDLKSFIAYAKAHPGEVRYSQVYGTITHYVGNSMEETMGIKFNMLDVGAGGAARLAAFMGDQVDVLAANYLNVRDYVEKGDFIVLGVCADKRVPGMEKVPTFKEQGFDISYPKSYELKFPKGTNKAVVEEVSKALEEIAKDSSFKSDISKYYATPYYRNGETTVKEDTALIEKLKQTIKLN